MKTKKIPFRTCVQSKEKLEKKDLIRIVKNKEGLVFIDDTLKAGGRGCYLKRDKSVIEAAKRSKVVDRSLGIQVPETVYTELMNKI